MEVKKFLLPTWLLLIPIILSAQLPTTCENAMEVFCGETYELDIAEYDVNTPASFVCGGNFVSPIWFKIEGTGEVIDFKICDRSLFEVLLLTGSCGDHICQEINNTTITYDCSYTYQGRFKTKVGESYFILVILNSIDLGVLSLSIQCAEPAVNDECEGALIASLGVTYTVNALSASIGLPPPHFTYSESGDLWYIFTGSGNLVSFTSSSGLVNGSVYEGACEQLISLNQSYIGYQEGYLTEAGKNYYLQVRMYGTEEHSFTLTDHLVASSSYCAGALELPILDTFTIDFSDALRSQSPCNLTPIANNWFTFLGNDSICNVSFSLFLPDLVSGDCANFNCETITHSGREFSFLTRKNVRYYIDFLSQGGNSKNFAYFSPYKVLNESYEEALEIACHDSIAATLEGALYNDGQYDYNLSGQPDLWYSIVGSGKFYSMESQYLPSTNRHFGPRIDVFKTVDDGLEVHYDAFSDNNNVSYFLADQQIYYVRVSGEADSFYLKVDCVDAVVNDECISAIEISTDEHISGVNHFSAFRSQDSCFDYGFYGDVRSDIWYSFSGNDQLMEFAFERSENGALFAIYEGGCQDLNCIYILPLFDNGVHHSTNLFFEKGRHYFIKVFSFNSSSNEQEFLFHFKEIVIAPNDQACTAYTLKCGDVIDDSTTNATINELGCDGNESGSPGIWYMIEGNDQYYELSSNYEVGNDLLYSLNPTLFNGTCNQLICQSNKFYRYQNKWVFYGKKGQTYYIMFNDQIPIKLKFNCFSDLGNDQVFKAKKISCGNTFSGYAFNAKREDYALCGGRSDLQKDIWFRVVGTDEFLFVNEGLDYLPVNSGLGDIYLKYGIFYKCAGSFEGNRFFLEKGVEYYIRIIIGEPTLMSGFDRDFQVTFTCHAKVENDACSSSISLDCSQMLTVNTEYATDDPENLCGESYFGSRNIWFTVDGDNSFKQLDVVRTDGTYPGIQAYIFSGECGQLDCMGSGPFFYAEAGKKYYINLGGGAFYGELQITLQCSDGAENDLCHDALTITCGQLVTGTFNRVKPCDYADPCQDFLDYKRVWYQFTGNGSLINLKLTTTAYNSHLVRVAVFSGGCCNPEEIRYSYIGDSDFNGSAHKDVYFLSEEGVTYLIAAEQFFITVEDASFDLSLTCLDLDNFHLCENAVDLEGGIETEVEVGDYFVGSVYNSLFGLVKWKGSGAIDTLILYGEYSVFANASFWLLPGGECALRYPVSASIASEILRDDQKVVYVIPTVSGEDYLIRIGRGPNYTSATDMVRVLMKSGSQINSCVMVVPDQIHALSIDQPIIVPFSFSGGEFPVNVYIRDSDNGPTYYNTFFEAQNIELYSDWTGGLKLVEFFNETCRGYGIFNLVFTDLPDHICPDSIYCPDQIVHLGEPLNSSRYQAQFDIKSNAQIIQGSQVIYQAAQQILFNPGFEVFQGATLEVKLAGCREENSGQIEIIQQE